MKSRKDMWIRGLAMMSLVMVMVVFTQAPQYAAPNNTQSNAKVKNVILLIADGCGYNCFQAASNYQYGKIGEQVYEKFPFKVGVSTYEYEYLDYQPFYIPVSDVKSSYYPGYTWYLESGKYVLKGYETDKFWNDFNYPIQLDPALHPTAGWYVNNNTDSASAATAMSTGFKTKDGSIGYAFPLNPDGSLVVDAEGKSDTEKRVNIVEIAKSYGMAAGVVSSVYMSHATPAGFVAHNKSRSKYGELANEMIYASGIDVIMAPGSPDYTDAGTAFPCVTDASGECAVKWSSSGYYYFYDSATPANRSRLDYVGDLNTWLHMKNGVDISGNPFPLHVIREKSEFQAMATGETPARVLGLPKVNQTLQAYRPGDRTAAPYVVRFNPDIPTLEEMSKAALNVLDNNPKGFFLMIEGGAVDWANHSSQGGRMIEEQVDFNRAIEAVVDWVQKNSNWGETMVVVTADHETGYIWGPDSNPIHEPIVNNGEGAMPGMQYFSPIGWHTNSLVPLFAKGDAARLFNGYATNNDLVYGPYIDNTDIFKVIKYAIENYQQRLSRGNGAPAEPPGKAKGKK